MFKHLFRNHWTPFATSLATVAALCWAPASLAQSDASVSIIEEVIVTAQRREENLQEVPISISVFEGEQIERSGMRGARDYVQRLANVVFNENDQQGTKNGDVSIRGISDSVFQYGNEPEGRGSLGSPAGPVSGG